jgi:hypothetical protein
LQKILPAGVAGIGLNNATKFAKNIYPSWENVKKAGNILKYGPESVARQNLDDVVEKNK